MFGAFLHPAAPSPRAAKRLTHVQEEHAQELSAAFGQGLALMRLTKVPFVNLGLAILDKGELATLSLSMERTIQLEPAVDFDNMAKSRYYPLDLLPWTEAKEFIAAKKTYVSFLMVDQDYLAATPVENDKGGLQFVVRHRFKPLLNELAPYSVFYYQTDHLYIQPPKFLEFASNMARVFGAEQMPASAIAEKIKGGIGGFPKLEEMVKVQPLLSGLRGFERHITGILAEDMAVGKKP